MKTQSTVLVLCGLTVAAVVTAGLVHRYQTVGRLAVAGAARVRTLEVKGQVRSLEPDGRTLFIEHEAIPDFMPAMIMPFTVRDPTLVRGLAVGDRIRFTLAVTRDASWITRIDRLGGAVGRGPVAAVSSGGVATGVSPLEPGGIVPDLALTDQDGHRWRLHDYRGKALLLTFIYTRCPLPNYCPLMSRNFAVLQRELARRFPGQFQLVSVSFDPAFDTPAVLRQYAAAFATDRRSWTFACGTPSEIDRITSLFGVVHFPEAGAITHDLRTALIGPDGRLVHVWRSNVWTPEEVLDRVSALLTEKRAT